MCVCHVPLTWQVYLLSVYIYVSRDLISYSSAGKLLVMFPVVPKVASAVDVEANAEVSAIPNEEEPVDGNIEDNDDASRASVETGAHAAENKANHIEYDVDTNGGNALENHTVDVEVDDPDVSGETTPAPTATKFGVGENSGGGSGGGGGGSDGSFEHVNGDDVPNDDVSSSFAIIDPIQEQDPGPHHNSMLDLAEPGVIQIFNIRFVRWAFKISK